MIKFDSEKIETIQNIYKEYFMTMIASILKVGPQIINLFGYEIIFLKNVALFGM